MQSFSPDQYTYIYISAKAFGDNLGTIKTVWRIIDDAFVKLVISKIILFSNQTM